MGWRVLLLVREELLSRGEYITISIYMENKIYRRANAIAESVFGALSNLTRLRCVVLLQREGELCVCELTHALQTAQPVVSRHLGVLREAGVVSDRRQGLWIHYRVNPDLPEWALAVVRETVDGLAEQPVFAGDRDRLQDMPDRPGGRLCA